MQKRIQIGVPHSDSRALSATPRCFSELQEEALVTAENGSKAETPKGINESFCE